MDLGLDQKVKTVSTIGAFFTGSYLPWFPGVRAQKSFGAHDGREQTGRAIVRRPQSSMSVLDVCPHGTLRTPLSVTSTAGSGVSWTNYIQSEPFRPLAYFGSHLLVHG